MRTRIAILLVAAALLTVPAAQAQEYVVTGNITSGAQFDLWALALTAGQEVTATLVCDFDGVSRPLDPVLSVFRPSNPNTPNPTFADFFDDDGFGTDDYPWGVDCDAFDSSIVIFTADETGTYTFRADGFGSSTGPYTLTIGVVDTWVSIPTLDTVGFAALALVLAAAGLVFLRRRRHA